MLTTKEKLELMEKEMSVSWDEIDSFLENSSDNINSSEIDTRNYWGYEWAQSKYPIFERFGNKLKLSKEVENTMSPSDISDTFKEIIMQDGTDNIKDKMGKIFFEVDLEDLQNNKLSKDYIVDGKELPKGMKVSKTIKFFLEGAELHTAQTLFSRFKECLEAKGKLELSIDPMDIICMSVNETRDWSSCHNIINGMYGAGAISYLLDGSTAIAQIITGRGSNHTPEKLWRRMVYFNKDLDIALLSRHYPSANKNNTNTLRELLTEEFGDIAYGMIEKSKVYSYINEENDAHYNDITRGGMSKVAMVVLDKEKYHINPEHKDASEEIMRTPYENSAFDGCQFNIGYDCDSVPSASGYYISGEVEPGDTIDGRCHYDHTYDEDYDDDYYD